MTLFEHIQDLIRLGYKIQFSREILNLEITIGIEKYGDIFTIKQQLPLSDHFHEARIINCIEWSLKEIDKVINKKLKEIDANTRT